MKAYAMLGIGKTAWIEKERPHCGPMDAILKPISLAPCTSDCHTVYEGAIGERHNMVLGHEAAGEVVEVGSEVKDFKVGDRVMVTAITPDWSSLEAQAGYPMHSGGMLAGWKFSNVKDGVFAEYFHVNDADGNLALIPEGVDPVLAPMLSDMVPTGFHGAELAGIEYGDSVLVIGIGPVGLMSVAAAAIGGAGEIIAVGTRPKCVDAAKYYGANHVLSYKVAPIDEQVLELTKGKGVDRVIIAGGTVHTFPLAVKCVRAGGTVANVNYFGEGECICLPRIEWGVGMGHKTIKGGLMPGGRRRLEKLANLVTHGKLDLKPLVTHYFNGLEGVEPALELMKEKPAELIKPVVIVAEDLQRK